MLPIEPVFREISRVLSHTSDKSISVEVATRAEIERARRKGLSSKPWGSKLVPATGSDPLRNKPELSEGSKGDKDLSTNFGTGASQMPSGTKAYRSPPIVETRFKDPETDKKIYRDSAAAGFPRLIQFLAVSFDSHHIDDMINEPNVTEKIRQLFQRVKMQDTVCRDFVRNLITTYGDATALILLKVSSDSKLFDDAVIAIEDKLTKALGMRKKIFVFEILASMEKRLRYLHNIADRSQRVGYIQFLLNYLS